MKTKKFLCALLLVVMLFTTGAFAAIRGDQEVRGGVLRYLGTSEEAFQKGIDELRKVLSMSPALPMISRQTYETRQIVKAFHENRVKVTFFDSLTAMLMALNAGKLDEISLPESTAQYVMAQDPEIKILFAIRMPSAISFGFSNQNESLRNEFNSAINSMKNDGTLKAIADKYINNDTKPEPVEFAKFDGAETIKVAVTGDMPPIDFVDEAGSPAGYNTAVISEIGKRLKKNIELLSIESGARSSALMSGRADVIFWYRTTQGIMLPEELEIKDNPLNQVISDASEGVILSEPYYNWDRVLFLNK